MSKEWPTVRLAEVLKPISRPTTPDVSRSYRLLGVRLDGNGAFHRETVTGAETSASQLFEVTDGDFIYSRLFAWRGAFGLIGRDLAGAYVSSEFPTFRADEQRLDPRFLNYWFRLPDTLRRVEADCTGSTPLTRNRFKEIFFLNLEIALPSIGEQRRIVDLIHAIAGKVEVARKLRREAEEETDALLSSSIDAIVGEDCPEKSLETVCDAKRPITYGIVQAGEHIADGVPYIRVSDMAKPQLSPIGMLRTSADIAARYQRSAVRHGDIVFAIRATIGKMRVVPESLHGANLTQGTARIAAGADAITEYLYWVLQGRRVADRIQAATKGSTFREITLGRLRNIMVPVPSLAIQSDVIARCRNLADQVSGLRTTQADAAMAIGALVPAVLDQAFRGEM